MFVFLNRLCVLGRYYNATIMIIIITIIIIVINYTFLLVSYNDIIHWLINASFPYTIQSIRFNQSVQLNDKFIQIIVLATCQKMLLLLLLSYHTRLKMTLRSARPARRGGWVHHSWHMSVVSHSYGGFGGGMDWMAVGKHARKSQEMLIAFL